MENPFTKTRKTTPDPEDKVLIFRYKQEHLEKYLEKQHEKILIETVYPLAKDLAELSKPEEDSTEQMYCGVIRGNYSKLGIQVKKDLQTEIEEKHLSLEKEESQRKLKDLNTDLEKQENELRLSKRELAKHNSNLLEKENRYKKIRFFLMFMILIDTFLSGKALQNMGYNLMVSYLIAFGIGIGIFYLSERIPEIIARGRNVLEKRLIGFGIFIILAITFYVLGIFRSISFTNADVPTEGFKPIYFMFLNLFLTGVSTTVSALTRLTKQENQILDVWKTKKRETKELEDKVSTTRKSINKIHQSDINSELSRKQLQIYAHDMQQLIQQLYGEALQAFISTNMIHRPKGSKVPPFFSEPVPKLPNFYDNLIK